MSKKIKIFILIFIIFCLFILINKNYKYNIKSEWKIIELAKNWAWVWHTDPTTIWNEWKLFFSYVSTSDKKNFFSSYSPKTNEIFPINISTKESYIVDSHDHPSLTVLPDKNIFLSYNRHWKDNWFFFQKNKKY